MVGELADLDWSKESIKELIQSVHAGQFLHDELVDEMERRGHLDLLLPWLIVQIHHWNVKPGIRNAFAKILIDRKGQPKKQENFLR